MTNKDKKIIQSAINHFNKALNNIDICLSEETRKKLILLEYDNDDITHAQVKNLALTLKELLEIN